MWLCTFETAEKAARAYDEAAYLLRGSNTRTNFTTHFPSSSPISMKIRNLLNHKRILKQNCPAAASATPSKATVKDTTIITSKSDMQHRNDALLSNSFDHIFYAGNTNVTSVCIGVSQENHRMFDDVYRPELRSCNEGIEQGLSQLYYSSWPFPNGFDQLPPMQEGMMELPKNVCVLPDSSQGLELAEFERIKVEKQISTSLYALNGVHEYLGNAYDPSDALWDLPTLSQLFCPS